MGSSKLMTVAVSHYSRDCTYIFTRLVKATFVTKPFTNSTQHREDGALSSEWLAGRVAQVCGV
jgi:hypothetical protein